MMKFFLFILLFSSTGLAEKPNPKMDRYRRAKIDLTSFNLSHVVPLPPGAAFATIRFKILPQGNCEDQHYAGLSETHDGYQVVYRHNYWLRCDPKTSRPRDHSTILDLDFGPRPYSRASFIRINGAVLKFENLAKGVTMTVMKDSR